MTGDELSDFAATVASRQDFIQFVKYLNADYREHREEWENDDLESFLGGLSGFANDMSGYFQNMGETIDVDAITWRIAAEMLFAASVYGN